MWFRGVGLNLTCILCLLAAVLTTEAQQPTKVYRVGWLNPGAPSITLESVRQGLRELGYVIGETESPIVPILIGDESRTIALWQRLLTEGLYVNLIVPPGCPVDECVLRASCSAAHTPEHLTRALDILGRVGAELGITRVALS